MLEIIQSTVIAVNEILNLFIDALTGRKEHIPKKEYARIQNFYEEEDVYYGKR